MERNLNLTIRMNEDDFSIVFLEPESGDSIEYEFAYSFDDNPEIEEAIGREIISWVSLWRDEQEENF